MRRRSRTPSRLPPYPPHKGEGLILCARQRAEHVDHPGNIVAGETHIHEALIQRYDAIEDRRLHADLYGHVVDHWEIMLQAGHVALHRQETAIRHPRRADAELRRATAAR